MEVSKYLRSFSHQCIKNYQLEIKLLGSTNLRQAKKAALDFSIRSSKAMNEMDKPRKLTQTILKCSPALQSRTRTV